MIQSKEVSITNKAVESLTVLANKGFSSEIALAVEQRLKNMVPDPFKTPKLERFSQSHAMQRHQNNHPRPTSVKLALDSAIAFPNLTSDSRLPSG